ncbi:MAG TPA: DUF4403 family protein [Bradyrhizobium sp.]|nr:DUF4403 family protein [Bradyrhizobium sp.]
MRLPSRPKTILIAVVVVAISFYASLKVMDWLSPVAAVQGPKLTQLPPLPPMARSSIILAPVSISLSAIHDAAERAVPRTFQGKANNPASQILQNADIGWTASRGPIAATGAQDVLSLATGLTGTLNVTGSLSSKATSAVSALGSLLGDKVAKEISSVNIKALNANAEIKGSVTITSRPKLAAAWHFEPNFGAQVNLGDTTLSVAGARVNVPTEVKPMIDKTVSDQLEVVADKIRKDQTLQQSAKVQWAKMCRSIPLQTAGTSPSLPPLWLELKPTKAIAVQPSVDASAVTATMGIEAETRITSEQTKPDCPFPDKISIIPPTQAGVAIDMPIDMSFTDVSKIVDAEFAGKTFPEDGSGPVEVTVKHASVAASGERLLISLLVHAKEKKSWFGFGADATVNIWGRPVLDPKQQTLRLTDVQLAVESEAAFGLLGAAARGVMPRLQQVLADKAVVDLKPFAANAQQKVNAALADFQSDDNGTKVTANVTSAQLSYIAFDSKTLRLIVEANGTVNVAVTALHSL